MNPGTRHEALRQYHKDAAICVRCRSNGLIHRHPDGRWARPLFHEEGTCRSGVLFVFEAPNFDDTYDRNKGRMTCDPSTDQTGQFLFRLLAHVGLTVEDVLLTNSVLCLPAEQSGKYPVISRQRDTCSHWLGRLIQDVNPGVVVACGGKALKATDVLERHRLSLSFGVGKFHLWYGRRLLPLYHTSPLGRITRSEQEQFSDITVLNEYLNQIPRARQKRFRPRGVGYKEIPKTEFLTDEFVQKRISKREEKRKATKYMKDHTFQSLAKRDQEGRQPRRIIVRRSKSMDIGKMSNSINMRKGEINMFVLNTDATSFGGNSPHNIWFEQEAAFTGGLFDDPEGYRKYGENVLGKLTPGDIIIMYANKIGGVGVGSVMEYWDGLRFREKQQVYMHPYEQEEYKVKTNWFADLRSRPIQAYDIIENNNNALLNRTLVRLSIPDNIVNMLKKYNVKIILQ